MFKNLDELKPPLPSHKYYRYISLKELILTRVMERMVCIGFLLNKNIHALPQKVEYKNNFQVMRFFQHIMSTSVA